MGLVSVKDTLKQNTELSVMQERKEKRWGGELSHARNRIHIHHVSVEL